MASKRGFAKLAGVSHQAVMRAVRESRLISVDGGLDPAEPTNAAFIAAHRAGESNGTDAQVAALVAKAALMRERLRHAAAAHVEKAAVADDVRASLVLVCAALALIPSRYARCVATALSIAPTTARALLQDFAEALLAETNGLPGQGHAAVMRLPA